MYSSSLRRVTSGLICGLIIILLSGCFNGNTSDSTTTTPILKSPTVSATSTSSKNVPGVSSTSSINLSSIALNKSASFNISSLNIQATPLACPMDDWLYSNEISYSGGNVALTSSNNSFDVSTISRLTTSINKNDPSLLPNGFADVLGAFIHKGSSGSCYSVWQITNTSQGVIQVNQISALYAANAQPNTFHYKLINLCSLPDQLSRFCGGQRGSGGGGPIYTFNLAPENSGTTVYDAYNNQPFSIDAGQTVPVELIFTAKSDYVYSIVPEITLNTSSQPLQLPQLASRVVFADSNIASCYQLNSNNTFVQDSSLTIPVNIVPSTSSISAECV